MKLLDLFSGIGGFHLGLEQSGFEFDWVGYSEIDKFANELYKRRFPNAEQLGDIKSIRPERLPDIDIVTFGFPCQDLSIAGKRGGLQANRSSLFFEAMRIIGVKKPKYFIFENVKGLFSSNEGKDFDIILRTVADFGYDGQWQLLNTRWFLPQNRERVYFVGHIRGEGRPKVFPIVEEIRMASKSRESAEVQTASTLAGSGGHIANGEYKGMNLIADYRNDDIALKQIGTIGKDSEATRVYDPSGIARTIKNGGGMGAKTGLYQVKPVLTPEKQDQHGVMVSEPKIYDTYNKKFRNDGVCGTLTQESGRADMSQGFKLVNKSSIRRLTPKECERLQGFPDGWTEGQSDTQRYKQLGNAVSVPVVKAIGDKLFRCSG